MEIARWVLAAVLALLALYLIAYNWTSTIRRLFSRAPSMIPILGGVAGCAALLIVPAATARSFAWLPLIVDPGCALALVFILVANVPTRGK